MPNQETAQHHSELASMAWTEAEIEQLCWDAGVLKLVITCGFRKAAADAFMAVGYRLVAISRDKAPFENLFKLSLYALGDRKCLGRREMKTLVLGSMAKIGCTLRPNDCHVDVTGRRVAASVVLPPWAWPG